MYGPQITDMRYWRNNFVSCELSCYDDREIEALGVLEELSEGSVQ